MRNEPDDNAKLFEVAGAGFLAISAEMGHRTGSANGCGVEPSWTAHGYSGGVMDRGEMRRLRDHLNSLLESK